MPLLPAVVPAIPETRTEIVPARLARKIAPLFGVPWADSPFGDHTWVSDFGQITLSEIARGAPLPTRSRAGTLVDRGGDSWELVDRVGITGRSGSLPNEIANATLNRFGPDTKAAVILTAVNRLLDPIRQAVDEVAPMLVGDRGAPLSPGLRLAGWAALMIEAFRSQPALFAAGIRSRAIQRQLAVTWDVPRAPSAAAIPLTRCEISAVDVPVAPSRPRDLEVVDATIGALGVLDGAGSAPLARSQLHEETVGQLLFRLLAVGTLQDASHLWLSERAPGSLAVEALVPPTSLVDRFVRQTLRSTGIGDAALDGGGDVPAIPDLGRFIALPPMARRAVVIALLAILRQIQSTPTARERSRSMVLARLDELAELLARGFPDDDPVGAIGRCRVALMRVHTLRHDAGVDLGPAFRELLAATICCEELFRSGDLDRGAAAEIVSASNIEVNAVRWTNARRPDAGLPEPGELDELLRRRWQVYLDMLEVPPEVVTGADVRPDGLIGYHLHNYAAFLASHADREADLLAAVRLYRELVVPAREQFFSRTGSFEPLRIALQTASRATTALAESAVGRSDLAGARTWAALGRDLIMRALADDSTRELLAEATESACRFALRGAPALVVAGELAVGDSVRSDAEQAAALLAVARRWERRAVGDDPGQFARHDEVAFLAPRVDALLTATAAPAVPAAES